MKESLREFPATTWNDVYNKYNTKHRIEEDRVAQPMFDERAGPRHSESGKRTGKNKYEHYMGPAGGDNSSTHVRVGDYSFNVSISELVAVLKGMGDKVRWPKEMRSDPRKRNPDHWFEFHNDHGHRIADYWLLQGEVENLLKQGYLTDLFSEKGRQSYMKNKQEPPKPISPETTVNVITGGDEVNGVTYTATKKTSKVTVTHGKRIRQALEGESITFDDEDVDDLMIPHNDALELVRQFQSWKVVQIPREENAEADALANLTSVTEMTNPENAIMTPLLEEIGGLAGLTWDNPELSVPENRTGKGFLKMLGLEKNTDLDGRPTEYLDIPPEESYTDLLL
uniref:Uncharacterized protein n=1 Tax=Nicotiana tabacum TaxID=4097 RepID=A0A1S3X743_TOBAC|nr:PREDICTED: uncharacterized protein LOC107761909 [Nicotiana tabacum]